MGDMAAPPKCVVVLMSLFQWDDNVCTGKKFHAHFACRQKNEQTVHSLSLTLCTGVSSAIAEPGSVKHEIGGGIHGKVSGHDIAMGNREWISKHAQLPQSNPSVQPEASSPSTHSQTEVCRL